MTTKRRKISCMSWWGLFYRWGNWSSELLNSFAQGHPTGKSLIWNWAQDCLGPGDVHFTTLYCPRGVSPPFRKTLNWNLKTTTSTITIITIITITEKCVLSPVPTVIFLLCFCLCWSWPSAGQNRSVSFATDIKWGRHVCSFLKKLLLEYSWFTMLY